MEIISYEHAQPFADLPMFLAQTIVLLDEAPSFLKRDIWLIQHLGRVQQSRYCILCQFNNSS